MGLRGDSEKVSISTWLQLAGKATIDLYKVTGIGFILR
jgi:hypothetical protein